MVTVKQRFIHMAPRKLRLIADLVRGKSTPQALALLAVTPRIATQPISHAIKSALSATKKDTNPTDVFTISSIFVDEGPALKRRILRSRGRATRMEHRMSHVTITLTPVETITKSVKKTQEKK